MALSPPPTASISSSLILLPPSPASSHSSLTSDEVSFDHLIELKDTTCAEDVSVTRGSRAESPRRDLMDNLFGRDNERSRSREEIGIHKHADRSDAVAPFASQVTIKGWKIVGGDDWRDVGRLGAYVVYDIQIRLRDGGNISILRRYTEFVRLRTALKKSYPQITIPPLPGKLHMTKFSPKFLEDRLPRLQRFLRGVILHPEMGCGGPQSIVGSWVLSR